jgi:outer membrane protein OmpA-like peptidoglycan-associated protein
MIGSTQRFFLLLILFILTSLVSQAQLGVEPDYPSRQNLGPSINSAGIEILPVVSPDGKTLYFDRKYDTANVGGIDDDDDIYYSTLQSDGRWSPARNIGPPLNTRGSDVLFWISPDGNAALVHNGALVKGKKLGLAISHREGTTWGTPVPIRIDGLTDLGDSYYAFISPDQKRLILSIHRGKRDPEDFDLFLCEAKSNDLMEWREPKPILALNTTSFEGAPFMASDNRTLYFNSDREGSEGETDLYLTRRVGESWNEWTPPVNLGPSINTPVYEASISIPSQGDFAYMSGTGFFGEAFYGKSDLFRIKIPDSLRPAPTGLVSGRMLVGDRGVEGLVRAVSEDGRQEVASTASDKLGRFILLLPFDQKFHIVGSVPERGEKSIDFSSHRDVPFTSVIINFDTASASPRASDSDITASLMIGPVHFASGSAELSPDALHDLQKYIVTLREAAKNGEITRLAVTGHTDDIGESDSNQELSLQRAGSVRRWLIANGISPRLISTDARGETEPTAPNTTDEGRAANRRVELRVISARK